jgi:hypothetical protein
MLTMNERVFNGNRIISPLFVILLVFGVFLTPVAPPLGLGLVGWAIVLQRRFRGQHKAAARAARDRVAARREADNIKFFRQFG